MNFKNKNIIKQFAEDSAKNNDCCLIDFILRGTPQKSVIEVFIDGKENISADVCAKVSREISTNLDEIINEKYDYKLVVSSPGIDRPLVLLDQYHKHIGRKLEVIVIDNGNKKKLTAKLNKILDNDLFFETKNSEEKINFNNIIKAKVIISFS